MLGVVVEDVVEAGGRHRPDEVLVDDGRGLGVRAVESRVEPVAGHGVAGEDDRGDRRAGPGSRAVGATGRWSVAAASIRHSPSSRGPLLELHDLDAGAPR